MYTEGCYGTTRSIGITGAVGLNDGDVLGTRTVADAEGIVDELLSGLGTGRLAHVNGAPVGALKLDGDTLLAIELAANTIPAEKDPAGFELQADGMQRKPPRGGSFLARIMPYLPRTPST